MMILYRSPQRVGVGPCRARTIFDTAFLLFAAGLEFLLLSFIIYAPGTILFFMARREQGKRVFTAPELLLFVISVVGAIIGVVGLVQGWITI